LLAGKVAFVAGGSSGINLRIAQVLAGYGAKIGLISRSEERITKAAQSIIAADVRDYEAVDTSLRQVHEQLGDIDIVVSGAAGNFLAPALGLSSNAFRTVVEIDLIGTFNVFRACFAYLRKPGASLIAITADLAIRPVLFQAHASAAKAGVNALTKCLAMEWGPAGIRVNAIAPGPIADTVGMTKLAPSAQAVADTMKPKLALRDFGTKQDVADAAVFLCSEAANYVTGIILNCDGGLALGDASGDALTVRPRG
jgi:NAD(P)-dependent dehydrogenase (short-subunit alcohol dehydrogenase family)